MIKKPLLFFLLTICNFILCQEIKTENNITSILSNSNSSQLSLSFTGDNSFTKNKFDIVASTNYNLTFSPKVSENEFMNRLSFDWRDKKLPYFASYQFNYSYIRNIKFENFFGIGSGIKREFKWIRGSISYAILFHNSNYIVQQNNFLFRHSLRLKWKIENKNFEISSEYFYQPDVTKFNDFIIIGTSKLIFFPQKKLNFSIIDIVNYRSVSDVKLIHNFTLGIGYKFNKKL